MGPDISMLAVAVVFIFFVSSHPTKTCCFYNIYVHSPYQDKLFFSIVKCYKFWQVCYIPQAVARHSSISLHVTKEQNALLKKTH
jgi:hypothetical protein